MKKHPKLVEIKERIEVSKKFSEELIRDKEKLANGSTVNKDKGKSNGGNEVEILPGDYQKIRKAIIEEIIKKNSQDGRIKEICGFNGDNWSRACGPAKFGGGYKEGKTSLVHKDFTAKYDNWGVSVVSDDNNFGKIHSQEAFTNEEGIEIEKIVSAVKNKDIRMLKNKDNKTGTKNQLISEINRLKAENEELKNNKTLTNLERQKRLQQNQQRLEEIQNIFDSNGTQQSTNNSNNNFPTGGVIGGGILAVIGLTALFIVRNKKKKRDVYKIKDRVRCQK